MMDVLRALAPYHDYGWFVALLAWTGAGVAWMRTRRGQPEWAWLPWAAWPGATAALIELVSYSREVRPVTSLPDFLYEDVFLGIAAATLVAGWIRSLPVRAWLRAVVILTVFATAGGRAYRPYEGALIIAVVGTLVAVLIWTKTGRSRTVVAPLIATVAGLWLASAGPLASSGLQLRAWIVLGEWSALWSTLQAVAAVVAMVGAASPWFEDPEARREWRPLLVASIVWLILGMGLALEMSAMARENFERQALTRTRAAAALMDRNALALLLNEEFILAINEPRVVADGRVFYSGRVARLIEPAAVAPRDELARIEEANPDLLWIYIQTLRDRWIVTFASLRYPGRNGGVGLRPVTEEDVRDWEIPSERFLAYSPGNSRVGVISRAPVVSAEGVMLGWLAFDLPLGQWVTAQTQPRLQAYLTIILGLGLAALVAMQRVRTREREAARSAALLAEQSDRQKTAFLANVSHELRTPIQSVLGYGELLRPALQDPVAVSRLTALHQHGELMLRLVNDLLDLSAIQSGSFRFSMKPVNLGALVLQTVDSMRLRAEKKGLVLKVEIDSGLDGWRIVDPERVRQVLINLVGNAIKFTDFGGVNVSLNGRAASDDVLLEVRDTGPGIALSAQARIFQPFERLESTAAKEGTGLGLALAKALCLGLGGELTVLSAPGAGATFRARFRAPNCASEQAFVTLPVNGGRLAGKRILVADDNALVRELFTAYLQDSGATVTAVGDGEQALAVVAREAIDAVVLDVAMPRLSGIEVARRLRSEGHAEVRIVGVSAHAGSREQGEALLAGMDVFLVKPIALAALLTAVAPTGKQAPDQDRTTDLLRRLREQFRTTAASDGARLLRAVGCRDYEESTRWAHHLMNSAAVVRDDRLYLACAAAERAAREQDAVALEAAGRDCAAALVFWTTGTPPSASTDSPSAQPKI